MRAFTGIILLAVLLLISSSILSKSLWRDKNIYSSAGNTKIGDILVVDIDDISQLKFSITLSNQNSSSINSMPDASITGFLPKVTSNKSISRNDNTSISSKGNLKISIASRIIGRLEDGKFKIAGTREYSFKGVTNRFGVSGIIDPALIKGRSIKSGDIANFQLTISARTTGAGIKLERPELKEGESAGSTLTEAEKQKIIIDYLERMLNELSR